MSGRQGVRLGWIGVGRMGSPLVTRLLRAGLDVARELQVAMPVAGATEQIVRGLACERGDAVDFAALLELAARASGLALEPEHVDVDDGLADSG